MIEERLKEKIDLVLFDYYFNNKLSWFDSKIIDFLVRKKKYKDYALIRIKYYIRQVKNDNFWSLLVSLDHVRA